MGIEKVTQQQRFTNTDVIIGADSDKLDSGLSVYGKITTTDRISSRNDIYSDKNLIATGNVSATDVSVTGFLYVTGGIVAPGLTTEVSPDKIKTTNANLGDVLKVTDTAGVTAFAPSRVKVEELSADAPLILDGATISYDGDKKAFTAKNPEEAVVYESSYIKQLAKSTCWEASAGFAAITNDSRVIAWGYIPQQIFKTKTYVPPSENIRVPFWKDYEGYTTDEFRPYGGDLLDTLSGTSIVDVYWGNNCAMALLSSENPEYDGTVWTAGYNKVGYGVESGKEPVSLIKNKYGSILFINETATLYTPSPGGAGGKSSLNILNPEKDICSLQKYTSQTQKDIIIDQTNNDALSSDSYYYVSCLQATASGNIKRINQFGELISTHYYMPSADRLAQPSGIAMVSGDNGKNLLYVCDTSARQCKVKIFDITDITNNSLTALTLVSSIGSSVAATNIHRDGETDGVQPIFTSGLKRIVVDPINKNISYVIDGNRLKRIYRKDNNHYKVTTVSNSAAGNLPGAFSLVESARTARFQDPYGIAISKDGKNLFIADKTAMAIQKVTISENDENNFNATSENYVNTTIENFANFNIPKQTARDNNGNLYIADIQNNVVRKIEYDATNRVWGKVTTLAGPAPVPNYAVAAVATTTRDLTGLLSAAKFSRPTGITFSPTESALYVTNTKLNIISRIDLRLSSVSTVGNTTTAGYLSGTGLNGGLVRFANPRNLCYGEIGSDKYLWVINYYNDTSTYHSIQQIKILGNHNYEIKNLTRTTGAYSQTSYPATDIKNFYNNVPVSGVALYKPQAITYDNVSNSLYFSNSYAIQKIDFNDNKIYTVAGSNLAGNLAGISLNARFGFITGLVISGSDLFATDGENTKVWRIENFRNPLSSARIVSEYAGGSQKADSDGVGGKIKFASLNDICLGNDDDLIISNNYYIKRLYKDSSNLINLKTINGTAVNNYRNTEISNLDWAPTGLHLDDEDNLLFTETKNDQIGFIKDKKVNIYKQNAAGSLGLGLGKNKSTCGFIMVKAFDENGKRPVFKRIQMVSDINSQNDSTNIFAALDSEDSFWLWGYSPDGAFGNGFLNHMGPTKIYQFDKNVKDFYINCATISAGNVSLITVITKDNKLFAAGDNTYGQLGVGLLKGTLPASPIFRQCKKNIGGVISPVDDAEKTIKSAYMGLYNNFYISTLSTVWACGRSDDGLLGRGNLGNIIDPYFQEVDNISNIKEIIAANNSSPSTAGARYTTVFALNGEGNIFAWGRNGTTAGLCLINDIAADVLYTPQPCYNYETKSPVNDAIYITSNDKTRGNHNTVSYIDKQNNLYIGGYLANVELPELPVFTPYFRKFNMKNIMTDVCLVEQTYIVRKSNGTVYTINSFGAKKVF